MIEYRFRVPSAAVFTLYSYSKALEYRFRVPTANSLISFICHKNYNFFPSHHNCKKKSRRDVAPFHSVFCIADKDRYNLPLSAGL
jgi:hypothetical protein